MAQGLYFAFAGFFAVASVVQITRQVFFPPPAEGSPFATCHAGLSALYDAIERGRAAAEHGPDEDEEAALRRYRDAVFPEWRHRDAVARLCGTDPALVTLLDAIERLRYSEEHSVRHEAIELAALRRKVKGLLAAPTR
ncbi:MAG: hypothetical protein FJ096_21540 [Deltaproteobacteria bacterium]|nr:hypothetical protein [Deltaproteobacteria bacterium]